MNRIAALAGLSDEEKSCGRRYPYEDEGHYLTEYLNSPSRLAKQKPLLESVSVLQEVARFVKGGGTPKHVGKIRTSIRLTEKYLIGAALSGLRRHSMNNWAFKIHNHGLVVEPTTLEARAAVAALWLFENGRIDRIKRCLHCRTWFYARFRHQQFCRDAKKKCQWNHYHSPDWRKRNRERNKKHQRVYRERLFGKRKQA